jgi:hypothetical protein
MPFEKGYSGNLNGRPPGIPNKVTMQLREMITDFLENNFEQVKRDFKRLPPKERARLYVDLLQYGLPKLQAMQIETEFDKLTDGQLDEIINRLINVSANEQK